MRAAPRTPCEPHTPPHQITMLSILILVLSGLPQGLRCLEITDLRVPVEAALGSTAVLICKFRLSGAKLYSVKWYKDESEFFRFMPDNRPRTQVFPLPGISIDESMSDMFKVALMEVNGNSTGVYRCEVSTEGPNFPTAFSNANMTVSAFPDKDPEISVLKNYFELDELVVANCSSGRSFPAPNLSWYINGIKADPSMLKTYETRRVGALYQGRLGLAARASAELVGRRGFLVLACVATVGTQAPRRAILRLPMHHPLNILRLEQHPPLSGSPTKGGQPLDSIAVLVALQIALRITAPHYYKY